MIVCPYVTHTNICNRYDNDDTLYYSYMIKSDVCVLICDSGRIKPDRACDLWTKCYVLAEVSPKHHLSPKVSPMSTVGAQLAPSVTKCPLKCINVTKSVTNTVNYPGVRRFRHLLPENTTQYLT